MVKKFVEERPNAAFVIGEKHVLIENSNLNKFDLWREVLHSKTRGRCSFVELDETVQHWITASNKDRQKYSSRVDKNGWLALDFKEYYEYEMYCVQSTIEDLMRLTILGILRSGGLRKIGAGKRKGKGKLPAMTLLF